VALIVNQREGTLPLVGTAAKLVLEPIFEADFEDNAYGYRPAKRVADRRLGACSLTRRSEVRFRGQTGKHLLALSFTGFDPHRTRARF
jgi:hypothetical protein